MPTISKKRHHKKRPYVNPQQTTLRYYNTPQWKNLRNRYIKEHPFCEMCLEKGIVKSAEEVHHIVPFGTGATEEERWNLLTSESNLLSLCIPCHKKIHMKMKDQFKC